MVETLEPGSIVVVDFPFSDLTESKSRPALVLAQAEFDNLILCQITSQPYSSKRAVVLSEKDFAISSLPITSYIRPDKIFTADESLIKKTVALINQNKLNQVKESLVDVFGINSGI